MFQNVYTPLPTTASGPVPHKPKSKIRLVVIWTIVLAIGFLVLFGIAQTGPVKSKLKEVPKLFAGEERPAGKRVYLVAGASVGEGMGSVLQHFKQSIVLSGALNSTLILANEYMTSRIFNARANASMASIDASKPCRISDHLPHKDRERLVRGVCAGDQAAAAAMREIESQLAICTAIIDTDLNETTEDLNGCIAPWVRERLGPLPHLLPTPLSFPPDRPVTVGVHIRWGDTHHYLAQTGAFYHSMALPHIVRLLTDVRAQAQPHGIAVTIAMENADADVLAQLGDAAGAYTLVDTHDPVADLQALGNNDVLLLGDSSYATLAHLIGPPGLTVVEFSGDHHKYTNTSGFGRVVVNLNNYTADSLRMAFPGV